MENIKYQKLEEQLKKIPSGTMVIGTLNTENYEFTPTDQSLKDLNQKRREKSFFEPFYATIEGMETPVIKGFISTNFLHKKRETRYGLDYQGLMKIADLLVKPAEILTSGFIENTGEVIYQNDKPLGDDAKLDDRGFVYYTGKCDIHGNPQEWLWVMTSKGQEMGTFLDEARTKIKIKDTIYSVNTYGEIEYNPFLNDEDQLSR